MSCILRISGTNLNLDELPSIGLFPDTTWEKGKPKYPKKPDGKINSSSGARYVVSEADFDEFEIQKTDAIEYLKVNRKELKELMSVKNIEEASLDFAIERRDVVVQSDFFQPELLRLSGELSIGIMLSQYPIGNE
jgi:hypothetical protein